MKNKKGFTMIELTLSLALIVLLALLMVPNIIDVGDSSKEKMYDAKIDLALKGAYKYGKEHIDSLSSECSVVTIDSLINEGYLTPDDETGTSLVDPLTGETLNNIAICIYYTNNEVRAELK